MNSKMAAQWFCATCFCLALFVGVKAASVDAPLWVLFAAIVAGAYLMLFDRIGNDG